MKEVERSDREAQGRPEAQGILASEVTELVHGKAGVDAAKRISGALFSGDIGSLSVEDLQQLELDGLPCTAKSGGELGILEALVDTELAKSNKMAREFISNNAVSVNGQVVGDLEMALSPELALHEKYFVLKRGKKLFHLLKVD